MLAQIQFPCIASCKEIISSKIGLSKGTQIHPKKDCTDHTILEFMCYFKLKIKVVIPTSTTLSAATRDCE